MLMKNNFPKKSKKLTPSFPKKYYTNRNIKKIEYFFNPLTREWGHRHYYVQIAAANKPVKKGVGGSKS